MKNMEDKTTNNETDEILNNLLKMCNDNAAQTSTNVPKTVSVGASPQKQRRNTVLTWIESKAKTCLGRFTAFLGRKIPENRRKLLLNLLLVVEIAIFAGKAIYEHSLMGAFMDAFNATNVGGLYSFASGFFFHLDDPLMWVSGLDMTFESFIIWSCSGFSYIALLYYNGLTSKLGFNRPMQIIHSIFFSQILGLIGGTLVLCVLGALILPVQPLWDTKVFPLQAVAFVLGAAATVLFVVLAVYSFKSLFGLIKDTARLWLFALIASVVLLAFVLLLERLINFSFLGDVANWFLNLFGGTALTEQDVTAFIESPAVAKGALAVAIFLMYNISAAIQGEDYVI